MTFPLILWMTFKMLGGIVIVVGGIILISDKLLEADDTKQNIIWGTVLFFYTVLCVASIVFFTLL